MCLAKYPLWGLCLVTWNSDMALWSTVFLFYSALVCTPSFCPGDIWLIRPYKEGRVLFCIAEFLITFVRCFQVILWPTWGSDREGWDFVGWTNVASALLPSPPLHHGSPQCASSTWGDTQIIHGNQSYRSSWQRAGGKSLRCARGECLLSSICRGEAVSHGCRCL